MRPVVRGDAPADMVVTEYGEWRPHLTSAMGSFCAFCGMELPAGDVEHVRAKVHAGVDELDWANLLLACRWCNDCKGEKVSPANWRDYLWPDVDNTARAFTAGPTGQLVVRANLPPAVADAAARSIALCQINRSEDTMKRPDPRGLKRAEAWTKATAAARRLAVARSHELVAQQVDTATSAGFWYIWTDVFAEDPEMLDLLTHAFPGTYPDWQSDTPRSGGLI